MKGILSTIGNTPLVELDRIYPEFPGGIYAKLERFNPGGSIKDRTAVAMLRESIRSGTLVPGRSTVVESSSGNLAIGLAQVCRYHGIRFVCVVDAKTTEHNLALLGALGAEIVRVTEPDAATGEYLLQRLRRVRELVDSIPHAFWPNQYANLLNPRAHHETMREIVEALGAEPDYLLCATSTTGTLRGCAEYLREHGMATRVVAVDAVGSTLFSDGPARRRLIPGHGASVRPPLLDRELPARVVHVTDLDCVVACRRMSAREAMLVGGSSGATVAALGKLIPLIPPDSTCVLIQPDGGDRYLDTIYSDSWVHTHFGDISYLWKESEGNAEC